ncbi:unnamed protein product [Symbiodinium natans]|uniref:Uncharacterized protein n=1 Tax=Symbiodinium natans TaxID=878477 RepID=A0A812LQZ5_9DINO|nr:unnamed protein product [Symbiodinium natans]
MADCPAAAAPPQRCRDARQWKAALEIVARIPQAALQPTVISLNSALASCEHTAQWPRACDLLRGGSDAVDRISYNSALSSLEKARQWRTALGAVGILSMRRLAADTVTINAAASACAPRSIAQKCRVWWFRASLGSVGSWTRDFSHRNSYTGYDVEEMSMLAHSSLLFGRACLMAAGTRGRDVRSFSILRSASATLCSSCSWTNQASTSCTEKEAQSLLASEQLRSFPKTRLSTLKPSA